MSKTMFNAQSFNYILPFIAKYIERNDINISKLSKDAGINRKTLYNNLYGDKMSLDFILKICNSLGIKIELSLASE